MNKYLDQVTTELLTPYGINHNDLDSLLGQLYKKDCDDMDIFIQKIWEESWCIEDSIIKDLNKSIEQGAGFRCVIGNSVGYAYSEDFTLSAFKEAALAASSISTLKGNRNIKVVSSKLSPSLYSSVNPTDELNSDAKVKLLHALDSAARLENTLVEKVTGSLNTSYEMVLIKCADGRLMPDIRPLVNLSLTVICNKKGERQSGFASVGGRYSCKKVATNEVVSYLASEAVRSAVLQFDAKPAPAGEMEVVLGSGWPGILLHEAIGHGLEGDFNRKKTSAFTDKIGTKVASKHCTVIDDATIADRRGSLNIDDEGTCGQKTTLIENGVLVGYMQDRQNGLLMQQQSTGNGRRESYAYAPMPRMTNTYMLEGEYDKEEIISSVKNGVYAVNFAGGQVDITSGKFVFSANEAYMIKNGKIAYPIKGATLIGDGPSVMHEVCMVGNDFALDSGIGTCGKDGQSVPVGVGQSTLKLNKMIVGGTEGS
jgi:TldD protein